MKKPGPFLCKPLHATFAEINIDSSTSTPSGSYHSILNDTNNATVSPDGTDGSGTSSTGIQRHMTLFDLVSIGVGGTIGSGVFVLCGSIAHNYAGPATCISWLISGMAACLSGVCYAEFACRMPAAGSSYVYVYASMGELPAVLVAACLTLEYVISAAAVARSWGDKMVLWMSDTFNLIDDEQPNFLNPGFGFNPLAALVSAASVILLINGVKESKAITNFFTVTKVLLVSFMALAGMILMKPRQNLTPFIPQQFGWAGVFRGATSSFFGFIGFDEVACMAQEALEPQKTMPLSILYTLGIVTTLYVLAALALTGMQPYENISDVSGFPVAFASNGWNWASQIVAFGEVFTLPIVVLIGLLAQPRLQYALAQDGLLPPIFAKVDRHGVLWWGTVISGILMIIVAAFIPFNNLNDMISAGILVAFAMTNSSLVLMRCDSPDNDDGLTDRSLMWFNSTSFVFSVVVTHFWDYVLGKLVAILSVYKLIRCWSDLSFVCKPVTLFGGKRHNSSTNYEGMSMAGDAYFKTPCMPLVPCLGIFVNWYLIAQLELLGLVLLLAFFAAVSVFYFLYGSRHSVGNNGGWDSACEESVPDDQFEGDSLQFKSGMGMKNDQLAPMFERPPSPKRYSDSLPKLA